jgi:hypothetical protein
MPMVSRVNRGHQETDAFPWCRYWADLHGQSGETIGMGTAEDYFRYARDKAFVDMVGHQGNDFQITDAFWNKLNELTVRKRRHYASNSASRDSSGIK